MMIEPRQKIYDFSFTEPFKNFFGEKIDENKLSLYFQEKFSFKNILTVSQGRIAIYLAVRAIISEGKNEIILSPYTVFDIVNMVLCAGAKPVFVDIEFPSLSISCNSLKKKINGKTSAIILTHYHSYSSNFPEIKTLAKNNNLKIIEDCAQVFGTKTTNTYVGLNSDISIFSFNITKFISTLSGGLLVCNDKKLFEKVLTISKEFNVNPFLYLLKKYIKALQIKLFTSNFIFNLFTRWILKFTLNSDNKIFRDLVRTDPNPLLINKLPKFYNSFVTNYQRKDILTKVKKYIESDKQKIRLNNYLFYQKELLKISAIKIHELKNDSLNGVVTFPMFFEKRDELFNFLISNNCDVSKYFYRDCSSLEIFKHFYSKCENSKKACNQVILLPVYPGYKKESMKKNVKVIKSFFNIDN